jgi:hypothetical protein
VNLAALNCVKLRAEVLLFPIQLFMFAYFTKKMEPQPMLESLPLSPQRPADAAHDEQLVQAAIYWRASGELDLYQSNGFCTLRHEQAQEKLEELKRVRASIVYLD